MRTSARLVACGVALLLVSSCADKIGGAGTAADVDASASSATAPSRSDPQITLASQLPSASAPSPSTGPSTSPSPIPSPSPSSSPSPSPSSSPSPSPSPAPDPEPKPKPKPKPTVYPTAPPAAAVAKVSGKGYDVKHPDEASWIHGHTLNVIVGVSRAGSGQRDWAFFFVNGKYIGTDTSEPSQQIELIENPDSTTLVLQYGTFDSDDPVCCPSGTQNVRYRWNGARLVPLDPIPSNR